MGSHAKVDTKLVKAFYVHFPGRRNHFSKGDLLKNTKGPRLTWMSACWLVEVFARPITAEDTSKLISDLENKLHCNWSVRSYMLVNSGPFAFFERSPLEKWFPRPGKWIWKSSASTLAYVPMIFRYFNQYPFIYWVKNRISHIFPCPGGTPEARNRKETESGLGKDKICTLCRNSRFVR